MATYAAFLRGINVGGNKKVPMTKLKTVLEKMGFENVRTLLASGNVIFSAKKEKTPTLEKKIRRVLEEEFGFTIPVLVREMQRLEEIIADSPFKGITVTKDIRLSITFLSEPPKPKLKIPYASADKALRILRLKSDYLATVLDLSKGSGTVDAMAVIEKEFGKNVTTRNWNTVMKVVGSRGE